MTPMTRTMDWGRVGDYHFPVPHESTAATASPAAPADDPDQSPWTGEAAIDVMAGARMSWRADTDMNAKGIVLSGSREV